MVSKITELTQDFFHLLHHHSLILIHKISAIIFIAQNIFRQQQQQQRKNDDNSVLYTRAPQTHTHIIQCQNDFNFNFPHFLFWNHYFVCHFILIWLKKIKIQKKKKSRIQFNNRIVNKSYFWNKKFIQIGLVSLSLSLSLGVTWIYCSVIRIRNNDDDDNVRSTITLRNTWNLWNTEFHVCVFFRCCCCCFFVFLTLIFT